MSTAATSLPERNAAEAADVILAPKAAAPEVLARRVRQRRRMYVGQVASYSLGASVLLLYARDWNAFSPGMRVTISAGVATLRDNDTADTFLARADSALYSAKAQGRNRIATS